MTDKQMLGAYSVDEHEAMMRANITGVVNNSGLNAQAGIEQTIKSTTKILTKYIDTLYYELGSTAAGKQKLSDFCKISVGDGAWATELLQYAVTNFSNNGEQGIVEVGADGINKDANVTIGVGSLNIPNNFWRMSYVVPFELTKMAQGNAVPFSIVEVKEKARKKAWDLMLQKAWFLGGDNIRGKGILTQDNATINTTLMPATLKDMTDAQFETFVATAPDTYARATLYTLTCDRFLMPTSDFNSLVRPFGTYGLTRLEVLERAFKSVCGGDFKIVHAKYCENANEAGNGARYVFYNSDEDNLCGYLNVPYTPTPLFPQGSLDLIAQAYGQFSTPYLKRTGSMLYADIQA